MKCRPFLTAAVRKAGAARECLTQVGLDHQPNLVSWALRHKSHLPDRWRAIQLVNKGSPTFAVVDTKLARYIR